jgi:hypothetical protein
MSQAVSAVKEMDPQQRSRLGTLGMIVGVVLLGVLGLVPFGSLVLQVVLGIVGVVVLVAGVLLVGTSGGSV